MRRDHDPGIGPEPCRRRVLEFADINIEHTPMSRLWSDPRVLITPHISSASDQDRHGAINLFCDNLRAYLEGGPLRNVIDWKRGY